MQSTKFTGKSLAGWSEGTQDCCTPKSSPVSGNENIAGTILLCTSLSLTKWFRRTAPFCLPWQARVCTTGTQGWRCGFRGKRKAMVGEWKGKEVLVACSQKQMNWGLWANSLGRQQTTSRCVRMKMERRGYGLCHDHWTPCPLFGIRPLGLPLTQTLPFQTNTFKQLCSYTRVILIWVIMTAQICLLSDGNQH